MYYVNKAEIERRIAYIPTICEAASQLQNVGAAVEAIRKFAAERAVHLAAECVTDIGSYMIDGFVMRDASSYEDIVDILHGENVFAPELYPFLQSLVRQRKPLVQAYDRVDGATIEMLAGQLPQLLPRFGEAVRKYIDKELP